MEDKILHIITGLGQGGAENILAKLVIESNNKHIRHIIISLTLNDFQIEDLRANNVEVHFLNFKHAFDYMSYKNLYKLIEKINPSIIFTWMYHANFIGGIIGSLLLKKKIIWNIHHAYIDKNLSFSTRILAQFSAFLSYFLPQKIIFCSNSGRLNHIKKFYSKDKCITICNGYDSEYFNIDTFARQKFRSQLLVNDSIFLIGLIARWHPVKDHSNFFKAISLLNDRANLKFILVGDGISKNNPAIEHQLRSLGIFDSFILYGPSKDMVDIYNSLDLNVLSSKAEAFPNTLSESMLCGTPCVSTNVGDASLIIDKYGWICPKMDSESLSKQIATAIKVIYKEGKLNIGLKARRHIVTNYDYKFMTQQFDLIFQNYLK